MSATCDGFPICWSLTNHSISAPILCAVSNHAGSPASEDIDKQSSNLRSLTPWADRSIPCADIWLRSPTARPQTSELPTLESALDGHSNDNASRRRSRMTLNLL